ncbi:MAG: taurine transport system substrate-binding protein [Thermoproteota archaeon]|jgi:taurine transport system substrate-binding protein
MKKILLLCLVVLMSACQKENTVTIGYQLMANPWKYLIATGKLKELDGMNIEFKKFNSGSKVINAMASGDIDIAIAGSTPIAAGLSQGLDIKLIWVMEIIGEAEAFVVRPNIKSVADLKGKKVGVPYGSTTHFHLMLALKDAGLTEKDVDILNLSPAAIVASWKKNEIDGAFVWAPALDDISKTGKVILSSKDMSEKGNPTFDGIIARSSFLKENKKFAKSFLNAVIANHEDYNKSAWTEESEKVKKIAEFVGSNAANVANTLKGYIFPVKSNHPTSTLSMIIKNTAMFLKDQGKIEEVLNNYDDKIAVDIIKDL